MGNEKKRGRPPKIADKPRTGNIAARVLPETEEILKQAAGGRLPEFLDEIARIISQLKDAETRLPPEGEGSEASRPESTPNVAAEPEAG